MFSDYQKQLIQECYSQYLATHSKQCSYVAKNGNDLIVATNSLYDLEDDGYISNLIEGPFNFSFSIEDSLIRYMKQVES